MGVLNIKYILNVGIWKMFKNKIIDRPIFEQ